MKKEALRFNEGKPMLSYFMRSFPKMVEAVARVKEMGAIKYNDGNWRFGNKPDDEYWNSMFRHLDYIFGGETYDKDTGCLHAAHAVWNLCALLELNYPDLPAIDEEVFRERAVYWAAEKKKREAEEERQRLINDPKWDEVPEIVAPRGGNLYSRLCTPKAPADDEGEIDSQTGEHSLTQQQIDKTNATMHRPIADLIAEDKDLIEAGKKIRQRAATPADDELPCGPDPMFGGGPKRAAATPAKPTSVFGSVRPAKMPVYHEDDCQQCSTGRGGPCICGTPRVDVEEGRDSGYYCVQHGGSPTCEEVNERDGWECPRCLAVDDETIDNWALEWLLANSRPLSEYIDELEQRVKQQEDTDTPSESEQIKALKAELEEMRINAITQSDVDAAVRAAVKKPCGHVICDCDNNSPEGVYIDCDKQEIFIGGVKVADIDSIEFSAPEIQTPCGPFGELTYLDGDVIGCIKNACTHCDDDECEDRGDWQRFREAADSVLGHRKWEKVTHNNDGELICPECGSEVVDTYTLDGEWHECECGHCWGAMTDHSAMVGLSDEPDGRCADCQDGTCPSGDSCIPAEFCTGDDGPLEENMVVASWPIPKHPDNAFDVPLECPKCESQTVGVDAHEGSLCHLCIDCGEVFDYNSLMRQPVEWILNGTPAENIPTVAQLIDRAIRDLIDKGWDGTTPIEVVHDKTGTHVIAEVMRFRDCPNLPIGEVMAELDQAVRNLPSAQSIGDCIAETMKRMDEDSQPEIDKQGLSLYRGDEE